MMDGRGRSAVRHGSAGAGSAKGPRSSVSASSSSSSGSGSGSSSETSSRSAVSSSSSRSPPRSVSGGDHNGSRRSSAELYIEVEEEDDDDDDEGVNDLAMSMDVARSFGRSGSAAFSGSSGTTGSGGSGRGNGHRVNQQNMTAADDQRGQFLLRASSSDPTTALPTMDASVDHAAALLWSNSSAPQAQSSGGMSKAEGSAENGLVVKPTPARNPPLTQKFKGLRRRNSADSSESNKTKVTSTWPSGSSRSSRSTAAGGSNETGMTALSFLEGTSELRSIREEEEAAALAGELGQAQQQVRPASPSERRLKSPMSDRIRSSSLEELPHPHEEEREPGSSAFRVLPQPRRSASVESIAEQPQIHPARGKLGRLDRSEGPRVNRNASVVSTDDLPGFAPNSEPPVVGFVAGRGFPSPPDHELQERWLKSHTSLVEITPPSSGASYDDLSASIRTQDPGTPRIGTHGMFRIGPSDEMDPTDFHTGLRSPSPTQSKRALSGIRSRSEALGSSIKTNVTEPQGRTRSLLDTVPDFERAASSLDFSDFAKQTPKVQNREERVLRRSKSWAKKVAGAGQLPEVAEPGEEKDAIDDSILLRMDSRSVSPGPQPKTRTKLSPFPRESQWNVRFREILAMRAANPAELLERSIALRKLTDDFVRVASEIGQTIIREKQLPAEEKSIPLANLEQSGFAGGEKYVSKGIFFKFAIDSQGLYGSDEFAAKAASHELLGIQAILSKIVDQEIDRLTVPLTALIDWNGFRLIASAVLPISGAETLCYGSADGGKSTRHDKYAAQLVQRAASVLNLKGHYVGNGPSKTFVYGPGDMEVHCVGKPSNLKSDYYLLDLSRLFPPEAKMKTTLQFPVDGDLPVEEKNYNVHQRDTFMKELEALLGDEVEMTISSVGIFYHSKISKVLNPRATLIARAYPPAAVALGKKRDSSDSLDDGAGRNLRESSEFGMMRRVSTDFLTELRSHNLDSQFLLTTQEASSSDLRRSGSGDKQSSEKGLRQSPSKLSLSEVVEQDKFEPGIDALSIYGNAVLVRSTSASFLHRLLRPELVDRNPVPLSSDAFTMFASLDDPERLEHRQEVTDATAHLLTTTVPRMADGLNSHTINVIQHADLIRVMHKQGINVRYLGTLRAYVSVSYTRSFILTEMCCRVLKNMLRNGMRRNSRERTRTRMSSREPNHGLIVDFFNLVLGHSQSSTDFWKTDLKVFLQTKFPSALSKNERTPEYDMRNDILLFPLFARLQELTGIRFKTGAQKQLFEYPLFWEKEKPLSQGDLDCISVQIRTTSRREELLKRVELSVEDEERPTELLMQQLDDPEVRNCYNAVFLLRKHRRLERVFGSDSPEVISSYFRLAEAHIAIGNFTNGLEYALRGLSFGEVLFGAFSEQTLKGLVAVGDALLRLGTIEAKLQAVGFYRRAIRSVDRLYRLHPLTGKLSCKLHFLLQDPDVKEKRRGGDDVYDDGPRQELDTLQRSFDAYTQMYGKTAATVAIPLLALQQHEPDFVRCIDTETQQDMVGSSVSDSAPYLWPDDLLQRLHTTNRHQHIIDQLKSKSGFEVLFDPQGPLQELMALPPDEIAELQGEYPAIGSIMAVLEQRSGAISQEFNDPTRQRSKSVLGHKSTSLPMLLRPSRRGIAAATEISVMSYSDQSGTENNPVKSLSAEEIGFAQFSAAARDHLPVTVLATLHHWEHRHFTTFEQFLETGQEDHSGTFTPVKRHNKGSGTSIDLSLNPVFVEESVRVRGRLEKLDFEIAQGCQTDEFDNNAQFAAISLLLFADASDADTVRRCAATWLIANPSFLVGSRTVEDIVGPDRWEQYCMDVHEGAVPGDLITLLACSQHYRASISVISGRDDRTERFMTELVCEDNEETIFLAQHNEFFWLPLECPQGEIRQLIRKSAEPILDGRLDRQQHPIDPLTARRTRSIMSLTESEPNHLDRVSQGRQSPDWSSGANRNEKEISLGSSWHKR